MWLPHSFVVLLLAVLTSAAIINTTIDDSSSSFTFTGTWNTITPSSPCTICSSKPDPSKTHGGTWRDGNINIAIPVGTSGSFTFTGSAVYIFGIDQAASQVSQADIAFTVGSIQQTHHYTGSEQFVYDALFFSATGLASDETHTVNWVLNFADTGGGLQVALFDYAIVTSGKEDIMTKNAVITRPVATTSTLVKNSSSNKAKTSTGSSSTSLAVESGQSPSGASQPNSTSSTRGKSVAISSSNPSNTASVTTDSAAGAIVTVTAQAQSVAGSGSRSRSNLGPIIGGVTGALAVTTLIILFLCLRRRRVRRLEPQTDKTARREFLRIENYPLRPGKNALPTAREVGNSAPVSFSTSGSKLRHRNNTSAAGLTGDPSTLPSPDQHTITPEHSSSSDEPQAAVNTLPTHRAGNLQFLEERVATLEAQVAIHQHPPPYVHEDDD